jgi:hypothetical protein
MAFNGNGDFAVLGFHRGDIFQVDAESDSRVVVTKGNGPRQLFDIVDRKKNCG